MQNDDWSRECGLDTRFLWFKPLAVQGGLTKPSLLWNGPALWKLLAGRQIFNISISRISRIQFKGACRPSESLTLLIRSSRYGYKNTFKIWNVQINFAFKNVSVSGERWVVSLVTGSWELFKWGQRYVYSHPKRSCLNLTWVLWPDGGQTSGKIECNGSRVCQLYFIGCLMRIQFSSRWFLVEWGS